MPKSYPLDSEWPGILELKYFMECLARGFDLTPEEFEKQLRIQAAIEECTIELWLLNFLMVPEDVQRVMKRRLLSGVSYDLSWMKLT